MCQRLAEATRLAVVLAMVALSAWHGHGVDSAASYFALPTSLDWGLKAPQKNYTGYQVQPAALRMIYFCDDTIAVVELGKNKLLLNCELIEVINMEERPAILARLSSINKPYEIGFEDMIHLMKQCQDISAPCKRNFKMARESTIVLRQYGIVPGTKWCGTGDIATNYFELGIDWTLDRCCRTHDICPVKLRVSETRYNLSNPGLYSLSHCACDNTLYNCIKEATETSPTAKIIGNVYFNVLRTNCIQKGADGNYEIVPPSNSF